ncbi:MAG: enoyl-CoA hydratase-related protein [Actinomycetota bacterium]
MSSFDDVVRYQRDGGVATITLNRPESLNSMNDDLMLALDQALKRVEADQDVRVLVLTGTGRGFCSGADLSGVGTGSDADGDLAADGDAAAAGMDEVFHPPIRRLAALAVPSIARINGVAAGGGLGLALACDIAVAARSARFVCTFGPRLGIVPDLGTTFHLPHRVGAARARAMAMLGDPISADQAAEWGLIWRAVDDADLDRDVADLAARLARSSPDAMARIRQSLAHAETNSLPEQLDLERDHQRHLIPRNMGEGAAAFREKREPTFEPTRWDQP